MKKLKAGIIGATGMVGQRFILLLEEHPYFEISCLAASGRSAGKTYNEAISGRWKMTAEFSKKIGEMMVYDASDIDTIKEKVDFVFCAVDMPTKEQIKDLEEAYAKAEIPVISNNSANRGYDDIPMLIPELNADHTDVIATQKKRLGTSKGFIAVKPNCSIQSYVPALTPLLKYKPKKINVVTFQAISGAGKTFKEMPEIIDNVIPYIGGEEEKSELEPLKIWGKVKDGKIINAVEPIISAQCIRVPVTDGHLAAISVDFEEKPSIEQILQAWNDFEGDTKGMCLPSSPDKMLTYIDEPNRPQTKLDRDIYSGMGITLGRLREDNLYDYKFIGLSHNTLRGAAGGGLLSAELLYKLGYLY
ncbi:aspartate-semialdehyde dehydrogenase [Eubacteriales bacterium OttesenSCG-928-G02]|nr:aspartate-semialdehyde dehydrogenase [Eubacteriales bacterium OttesenSCG-928-G02]